MGLVKLKVVTVLSDHNLPNVQTQYGGEEVGGAELGAAGNPLNGAGLIIITVRCQRRRFY